MDQRQKRKKPSIWTALNRAKYWRRRSLPSPTPAKSDYLRKPLYILSLMQALSIHV